MVGWRRGREEEKLKRDERRCTWRSELGCANGTLCTFSESGVRMGKHGGNNVLGEIVAALPLPLQAYYSPLSTKDRQFDEAKPYGPSHKWAMGSRGNFFLSICLSFLSFFVLFFCLLPPFSKVHTFSTSLHPLLFFCSDEVWSATDEKAQKVKSVLLWSDHPTKERPVPKTPERMVELALCTADELSLKDFCSGWLPFSFNYL